MELLVYFAEIIWNKEMKNWANIFFLIANLIIIAFVFDVFTKGFLNEYDSLRIYLWDEFNLVEFGFSALIVFIAEGIILYLTEIFSLFLFKKLKFSQDNFTIALKWVLKRIQSIIPIDIEFFNISNIESANKAIFILVLLISFVILYFTNISVVTLIFPLLLCIHIFLLFGFRNLIKHKELLR